MSAQDYLDRLKKRQPEIFAAKTIKIKVKSFEEQIRTAYNAGLAAGMAEPNLFDSLFDNRPPGFN